MVLAVPFCSAARLASPIWSNHIVAASAADKAADAAQNNF
jgi:hypothetical protein